MDIGQKIKKLRIEKGYSQTALAGDVFSRNYISQIERGVTDPSIRAIQHIAKVLNVPDYVLIEDQALIGDDIIDEINGRFKSARRVFMSGDYDGFIALIPSLIENERLLDCLDVLHLKVWHVEAYAKLLDWENTLEYAKRYLNEKTRYSRSEHKLLLKIKRAEAIVYYNRGLFDKAMTCFKAIEDEINEDEVDVNIDFIIENLSMIQVLYEFLGAEEEVDAYYHRIMAISKKHKVVTQGLLRSISRYYRNDKKSSFKEIMAYYDSVLSTAKLVDDWGRMTIVYSCLIEVCFRNNDLSLVDDYLGLLEETIPKLEGAFYPGYYIAYHHLYRGKYLVQKKVYEEAKQYFNKAVEFIEGDKRITAVQLQIDSLYEFASLYMKLESYASTVLYLEMAEAIAYEHSLYAKLKEIEAMKVKAYQSMEG
ncbi:helix-turn-helix transcriptional regulator [Acidaminobacter sp. JC074]|uniref:helix-turn-helix domain-containing protein n=1 Tax=Acidaminobacter sp. JC074 TaxID=2530199 RepID=UPI001F10958B|nr:helix-turn-helix transcriptional regulator [Acidaminobacter sp. JC074]MCH4888484.1 helix-turn-helix transcriptional regulator [Acidaminobacter sp. JC074]